MGPYAFVIEIRDEGSTDRWDRILGDEGSGIEESESSAADYAKAVIDRYLAHVTRTQEEHEWMIEEPYRVRVRVWHAYAGADDESVPEPASSPPDRYWRALARTGIRPDAVEVRRAAEVHRHVVEGLKAPRATDPDAPDEA